MIKSKDRAKWFGASDTHFIMGNYETQTFLNWWFTKLGILKNDFGNKYTQTGNAYEHKIVKLVEQLNNIKLKTDRQIKIKSLRLRVNLDSETKTYIREIKTTNKDIEKVPKNYWQQVQVQMFGTKKYYAFIDFYLVNEKHYENFFLEMQEQNLKSFSIDYDKAFIEKEYLPRLRYLVYCLKNKLIPTNEKLNKFKENNK